MDDTIIEIQKALNTLENPARTYMSLARIEKDGENYVLVLTNKQIYDKYTGPYSTEASKEIIDHIFKKTGVIIGFRYKDLTENARLLSGIHPTLSEEDIKNVTKDDIIYINKLSKLDYEMQAFIKAGIDYAYKSKYGDS